MIFLLRRFSIFLRGSFNKFGEWKISRCLPCFFLFCFSQCGSKIVHTKLLFFKLTSANCFQVLKRCSFTFGENLKTLKSSACLIKSSFDKPANCFQPKVGKVFCRSAEMNLRERHQKNSSDCKPLNTYK